MGEEKYLSFISCEGISHYQNAIFHKRKNKQINFFNILVPLAQ
jgi:hypothetical protein